MTEHSFKMPNNAFEFADDISGMTYRMIKRQEWHKFFDNIRLNCLPDEELIILVPPKIADDIFRTLTPEDIDSNICRKCRDGLTPASIFGYPIIITNSVEYVTPVFKRRIKSIIA